MKNHITVIDSPVGSGKSSWAIQYINELPDEQRFIFITPLLDEIERIQKGCEQKAIIAPKPHSSEYNTKSKVFKKLINQNKNIASTHALFLQIDEEVIELLRRRNYILILDEVFNVLAKYNYFSDLTVSSAEEDKQDIYTSSDINSLKSLGYLSINDEGNISWIKDDYPLSRYYDLEKLAKNEQLYFINDKLLWIFPKVVFSEGIFQEIFILTFQFRYQLQYYYFKYFNIDYQICHIKEIRPREYVLEVSDGNEAEIEWVKRVRNLININDSTHDF